MARSSIVLGLGFGDEGKGRTVSSLINRDEETLVVRFSGGQQAGHTVKFGGILHVFATFGSGTLQGAPTYISQYCTFSPSAAINELTHLMRKGITSPKVYVDPLTPVTTPFDVVWGRLREKDVKHGSVGAGVGQTIQRQEDHFSLQFQDLFYPSIMREKLRNIAAEYYKILDTNGILREIAEFEDVVDLLLEDYGYIFKNAANEFDPHVYEHIIYEGSQGILLDQTFGFFPHVTRSDTTSKNARALIKRFGHDNVVESAHYVIRAYQTRHGKGFMTNEGNIVLKPGVLDQETNVTNQWQGPFRLGMLDMDLISYALRADRTMGAMGNSTVHVTCMDQLVEDELIPVTMEDGARTVKIMLGDFKELLDSHVDRVVGAYSADTTSQN